MMIRSISHHVAKYPIKEKVFKLEYFFKCVFKQLHFFTPFFGLNRRPLLIIDNSFYSERGSSIIEGILC